MKPSSQESNKRQVTPSSRAIRVGRGVTKAGARTGMGAVKATSKIVRVATRQSRRATAWSMNRALGPHNYRHEVDEVVLRLTSSLKKLESVIQAQAEEIEQLRRELATRDSSAQ